MDELQDAEHSESTPTLVTPLLHEDDVVRAVMAYLLSEGWTIESFALSHQHGDDIVATRGRERLIVEAKGEGSSKSTTARYGESFTRNQVKTHVSVAIVRAMQVVSKGVATAGVALPDNEPHRTMLGRLSGALRTLGIQVYWVGRDTSVQVQN